MCEFILLIIMTPRINQIKIKIKIKMKIHLLLLLLSSIIL